MPRNNNRQHNNSHKQRGATRAALSTHASRIAQESGRGYYILVAFAAVAAIVFARLVFLQVIVADDYAKQAADARTSVVEISPRRGTIYDRNGNVLATSVEARSVYVNPREVKDAQGESEVLASVLGGTAADYIQELSDASKTFIYIQRRVEMETVEELQEKQLPGIHFLPDSKRIYPYGAVGGQVVGFVNVDDQGVSGIELYYNDILRGTPGKMVAEYGRTGIPIPGAVDQNKPAIDGQDIVISLDISMQEHLEKSLAASAKALEGKSGSSILMDGGTGEIYACASLPFFNPADLRKVEPGATDLQGITRAFEPGSIFKPVAAMAALEDGRITPDEYIFCPARLPADEYFVTDAHERGDETMSVRQIMARSSNVGLSKIAEIEGFPELYTKILKYGVLNTTGVDSPGEAVGVLDDVNTWARIKGYNVSFGQGVTVTPLSMERFFGAIINDGVACTPHFLMSFPQTKEVKEYPTERIIHNTKALPPMIDMLEAVVAEGTGTKAQIDGFPVAGKTGTAEYADEKGGYVKGWYNISFIGFLPHTNSKLVCFVGVTEVPGDRATTPAFKDIMTYAIERYKIKPE